MSLLLISFGRIALQKLDPFDSLRSLRVTVVGRVFSIKVPEEDSHPERRRWSIAMPSQSNGYSHGVVKHRWFHLQKLKEDPQKTKN